MKGGKKKSGEEKDRKQCVYQQTFGCCQLTARALGCQRKKRVLYNQAVIAGREKDRETDRQTGSRDGDRAPERKQEKKIHITT